MRKTYYRVFCLFIFLFYADQSIAIPEDEWVMRKEIWEPNDSLTEQFHKDMVIFYNTLFPNKKFTLSDAKVAEKEVKRRDFLKRVFLSLADGPLQYTTVKNGSDLKNWHLPLAVALGHGQRILFDLNRKGSAEDFYNLLLAGDPKNESGNPNAEGSIAIERSFATHGLTFKENPKKGTRQIQETKLGLKPSDIIKNAALGLQGKHRGVNLALGGLGNPDIQGRIIGPEGKPYYKNTSKVNEEIQHGHAYIQVATFPSEHSALMLGIESTAPGKGNMFGYSHNVLSGTIVKTGKNRSATGGHKMKKLLGKKEAPAELGGMRVIIDQQSFARLEMLFSAVLRMPEAQQESLFKHLLSLDALEAHKYLEESFPQIYHVH